MIPSEKTLAHLEFTEGGIAHTVVLERDPSLPGYALSVDGVPRSHHRVTSPISFYRNHFAVDGTPCEVRAMRLGGLYESYTIVVRHPPRAAR